ncbi:MAG: hypothetical protein IJL32_14655 [Oscillospiraceae bacterium]|nr:hypothetical protein [Oscillospiraceae bacterium]
MSSKRHKKKKQPNDQLPALQTEQSAAEKNPAADAAESAGTDAQKQVASGSEPLQTDSKTPDAAPGDNTECKPEGAAEQAAPDPKDDKKAAEKNSAKIVVPARIKVKTDRDGNLIESGTEAPKKADSSLRSAEPVRTVTPADIKKPQVSFMNSIANVEAETRGGRGTPATSQAYDHAVLVTDQEDNGSYHPKIRRMSDSTRAKELRKRQSSDGQPYQRVTPVSTPQTLPASKLRKRKEHKVSQEVLERIPETLKQHPLEKPKPIRYLKQAEHTQIILSSDREDARDKINIDVRYQNERRKRTDLPLEAKPVTENDQIKSVRNDLLELNTSQTIRVVLLGILTFFSSIVTLLDWVPNLRIPAFLSSQASPFSFLTIQLLFGFAGLLLCGSLLKNGYLKLIQFRADCDSLAAMSIISAELAAFLMLPSQSMLKSGTVSVYISVGLLSLLLNAVGKKLIATRALRNYERLTDGNPKYGIHYVEDERRSENLTRGTTGDFPILAAMQPIEEPEDFLKYTFSTDIADKFCRTAVPLILLFALVFSVLISFIRAPQVESAVCYGMSVFALCFSACACTAITLISNLPMAAGTKDYVRNSGLLLGYQSVDDFFDVNTIMVDAVTLFPRNATKLESIHVVGEGHIDQALQYAASLTQHAGSILKDLFSGAILAEDNMLLPVENYAYDEGKGISGWIGNKRVLLGTRDMMIEHSVEGIPVSSKVKGLTPPGAEALYLSVAGSVSALYIIRLETNKSVKKWIRELERENLFLIIRSNDAILSQRRIAKMFGVREERLKIIPARLEKDFAEETAPLKKGSPSMLCAGRLAGFVQTIVGAKRIRSAAAIGMLVQTVTACLGLLFAVLFIFIRAYKDVSGGVLLMYHLICTIVTVLSVRMKDT